MHAKPAGLLSAISVFAMSPGCGGVVTDGDASTGGGGNSPHGGTEVATGGEVAAGATDAGARGDVSTTGGARDQNGGHSSGPSCHDEVGDECQGESCCTALLVPGGTYDRVDDEREQSATTVSDFYLDKYEVTVGRFRRFVADYETWIGAGNPVDDAGEHVPGYGSGWLSDWEPGDELPRSEATLVSHLMCSAAQTWTDWVQDAATETRAINCVNWYEAFAFCIWDGGRLPTEAEWEYAAGAGDQHRLYPWGEEEPSSRADQCALANWADCEPDEVRPVGGSPAGAGFWGHQDLAGNVSEWNLDSYTATFPSTCDDCADLTPTTAFRALRGSDFNHAAYSLPAAFRGCYPSETGAYAIGVRCARTP